MIDITFKLLKIKVPLKARSRKGVSQTSAKYGTVSAEVMATSI